MRLGNQTFGSVYLSGYTGFLVAREDTDGFTESDGTVSAERRTELGQWNLGAGASLFWGPFSPFANVTYQIDYDQEEIVLAPSPQPSNDNGQVRTGLGLRYYGDNGISGYFE